MIPNEIITRVLGKTDLVELISQDMQLKRAGRAFKALCPFHNEKTASFYVVPRLQIYKCQGCGERGDAIAWMMSYHSMDFPTALAELAQRKGIALPDRDRDMDEKERAAIRQRADIETTLDHVQRFLASELFKHKPAMDYLRSRGLTDEQIRAAGLGYAPERYRILGHTGKQLIEAGVAQRNENRVNWLFRNRIMFPVWNRSRKLVGFGGRRMGEWGPKYLNSTETLLYRKEEILAGLGRIRSAAGSVCVVEGYIDELLLNVQGIPALGTCGTALTASHADLLVSRYPRIVLIFDGDAAGMEATRRAAEMLLPRIKPRTRICVLSLPKGRDPDEMLLEWGAEAFAQKVEQAEDLLDFLLGQTPTALGDRATHLEWLRGLHDKMPEGVLKDLFQGRLCSVGVKVPPNAARTPAALAKSTATNQGYFTISVDLRLALLVLSFRELVWAQHLVPDLMPEPARSLALAITHNRDLNAASICRLMTAHWRDQLEPLLSISLEGLTGTDVEAAYLEACLGHSRQSFLVSHDRIWRDRHEVLSERLESLNGPHAPTPIECLVDGREDPTALTPETITEEVEAS